MTLFRYLITISRTITVRPFTFHPITKSAYRSSTFITPILKSSLSTFTQADTNPINHKKDFNLDQKQLNTLAQIFSECDIYAADQIKSFKFSSLKDFTKLIINSVKPDVKIQMTNGKSFFVHSSVLSTRSKVFCELLQATDTTVDTEGIIVLKIDDDIEEYIMKELISFMYSNDFNHFTLIASLKKMGPSLYKAARKYEVSELIELCEVCLVGCVRPTTVLYLRDIANMQNIQRLKVATSECIDKHPELVLNRYVGKLINGEK